MPLTLPRATRFLLGACAAALLLGGCSHKIPKGTVLCAKLKLQWHLATAMGYEGERIKVRYYDQSEATIPESEVKLPLQPKEVKEGADVMAVWKTYQFYPGTVTSLTKNGAIIRWHDGSPPSEAAFGKIVAP